jgi:DNA-binding response OmpR family regulator
LKHIFIVEDYFDLAENIQEVVENSGFTVTVIQNSGKKALLKILKSQPDLAIIDVHLNGEMDGVELSKQIRKKSRIPIILLTANTEEELLERISKLDIDFLLIKPFSISMLLATVNLSLLKSTKFHKKGS